MTMLSQVSLQQLTVAPRDRGAFDLTAQAVQRAVEGTLGARVLRADPNTGVVVAEVPNDLIADFKRMLGDAFFVDPNAKLRF